MSLLHIPTFRSHIVFTLLFFVISLLTFYRFYSTPILHARQSSPSNTPSSDLSTITTTLVTAYYPLKNAKHSRAQYDTWIKLFLDRIESPILVYTDEETKSHLQSLTIERSTLRYMILPLGTLAETLYLNVNWTHQRTLDLQSNDPEAQKHSIELYKIWNTKPYLVAHAARNNPFNTSHFFWNDIGAYRDPAETFRKWPDNKKLQDALRVHASNPSRRPTNLTSTSKTNFTSEINDTDGDLPEPQNNTQNSDQQVNRISHPKAIKTNKMGNDQPQDVASPTRREELAVPPDRILINFIDRPPRSIIGTPLHQTPPPTTFTVAAGFFGGSASSMIWFAETYYKHFDQWVWQESYIGREENCIHALTMLYPSLFVAIPSYKAICTGKQYYYYYFRNFLASAHEENQRCRNGLHSIPVSEIEYREDAPWLQGRENYISLYFVYATITIVFALVSCRLRRLVWAFAKR